MLNNIEAADGKSEVIKRFGNTQDIIDVLLESDKDVNWTAQTADFSKQFEKSYKGLKKLTDWILENVKYKIDPAGVQWIKSPARTVADGYADCKSLTLLITSVLKNLRIRYRIRFVGYRGQKQVSHVYALAYINNSWLPLDTVWLLPKFNGQFGTEKKYSIVKDYERKNISND